MKYMVENRTTDALDPSPDSDCHMSKSHNVDLLSATPQEAFESTQVFIDSASSINSRSGRSSDICICSSRTSCVQDSHHPVLTYGLLHNKKLLNLHRSFLMVIIMNGYSSD